MTTITMQNVRMHASAGLSFGFPNIDRSVSFRNKRANGGVDRATTLPSSLAGSRLLRNTLPAAPVQRVAGLRPSSTLFDFQNFTRLIHNNAEVFVESDT